MEWRARGARRALRLAPALLAAGLASCADESSAKVPMNVVLICLDTVRADHLGCYGYREHPTTPALDRLAEASTLFADASATACWTKPSVPSFLTGTYPAAHGVYEGSSRDEGGSHSDVLPDEAFTLAEAFREEGYRTAAFVRNAQLRQGQGIEQGFKLYVEPAGDAREIRWRALDWLDQGAREQPFLLYLHFLDAHWPYPVPDEYAQRFARAGAVEAFRSNDWKVLRERINDGEVALGESERRSLVDLYDGALRYLDDQLELLFRGLAQRGLEENTVVCVVADHGEEFLEHGRIGHGHGLYENLLRVPWILRIPGRAPARIDAPVSLVDLFPTLLSAAGLRAKGAFEGVDRLSDPFRTREVIAEHKTPGSYDQSARRAELKVVRHFDRGDDPGAEDEELPLSTWISRAARWQVDYRVADEGALVATQIEPGEESPSDPMEIKGLLTSSGEGSLAVDGIQLQLTPDFETYGETVDGEGRAVELRPGLLVKAKIAVVEDRLSCSKLKLYAPGTEAEHELRGPISEPMEEGATRSVLVGPIRVLVDDDTALEQAGGGSPPWPRERLIELLGAEEGAERPLDVLTALEVFDLAQDPAELAPVATDPRSEELLRALDRWGRLQVQRAFWTAQDRTLLSEDELRGLEAIGYVR